MSNPTHWAYAFLSEHNLTGQTALCVDLILLLGDTYAKGRESISHETQSVVSEQKKDSMLVALEAWLATDPYIGSTWDMRRVSFAAGYAAASPRSHLRPMIQQSGAEAEAPAPLDPKEQP